MDVVESTEKEQVLGWRTPLAVSLALVIFVGTFFAYGLIRAKALPGSEIPAAIGIGVFFVAMAAINYSALSGGARSVRLMVAVVHSAIEAAVFSGLLVFLLVNTYGS